MGKAAVIELAARGCVGDCGAGGADSRRKTTKEGGGSRTPTLEGRDGVSEGRRPESEEGSKEEKEGKEGRAHDNNECEMQQRRQKKRIPIPRYYARPPRLVFCFFPTRAVVTVRANFPTTTTSKSTRLLNCLPGKE